MSNPDGDYTFAGLGFNGLRFAQDFSNWGGYLYYGEGSHIPIANATYTDATGVVTFGAANSPAGISDVSFTGMIILDMSGAVSGISGTWTGRAILTIHAAAAKTAAALPKTGPILPIIQATGPWAATGRRDIIP